MKDAVSTEVARVKTARDTRETLRRPSSSAAARAESGESADVSTEHAPGGR